MISHIKALGTDVWGQSKDVIALIDAPRKEGINATAGQYPYTASGTSVEASMVHFLKARWGESTLLLRGDHTMEQESRARDGKAIVQSVGLPRQLRVFETVPRRDPTKGGDWGPLCASGAEMIWWGDIYVPFDSDVGLAYKKLSNRAPSSLAADERAARDRGSAHYLQTARRRASSVHAYNCTASD